MMTSLKLLKPGSEVETITGKKVIVTQVSITGEELFGAVAVWCAKGLPKAIEGKAPDTHAILLVIGAVGGGMFSLGLMSANTEPTIKAWAAPRVLLLEKLNEMRR